MNNKGNMSKGTAVMLAVGVVLALAAVAWFGGFLDFNTSGASGAVVKDAKQENLQEATNMCGDTKQTTLTITMFNALNVTGEESFDVTGYFYKEDGSLKTSTSDTTSGSVTLDCGQWYTFRPISSDAEGGDNSRVLGVREGNGAVTSDGAARFYVGEPTSLLELYGEQHGILVFNAYDNTLRASIYDSSDASATDYEVDGVTFTSTTGNTTAMAVGESGDISIDLQFKSNSTDGDFNDQGYYILVEAPITVWGTPILTLNGVELVDIKAAGVLDDKENALWSAYEHIYFVEADKLDDRTNSIRDSAKTLKFQIKAQGGVNPGASDDIEIDFASKGAVKQTLGGKVRVSGATDASVASAVFTVQDVKLDIQ